MNLSIVFGIWKCFQNEKKKNSYIQKIGSFQTKPKKQTMSPSRVFKPYKETFLPRCKNIKHQMHKDSLKGPKLLNNYKMLRKALRDF